MCSMFQMNKVSAPDDGDNPEPQVLYKTVELFGLYVCAVLTFHMTKVSIVTRKLFHKGMLLKYWKISNASYVTYVNGNKFSRNDTSVIY